MFIKLLKSYKMVEICHLEGFYNIAIQMRLMYEENPRKPKALGISVKF